MPANKMPEMPEAVAWQVRFQLEGTSYWSGWETVKSEESATRAMEQWDRYGVAAEQRNLYTADQMRAMYLAGIADAKACVPEAMSRKNEFLLPSPAASFNACRDQTLANLSALEQGVGNG